MFLLGLVEKSAPQNLGEERLFFVAVEDHAEHGEHSLLRFVGIRVTEL